MVPIGTTVPVGEQWNNPNVNALLVSIRKVSQASHNHNKVHKFKVYSRSRVVETRRIILGILVISDADDISARLGFFWTEVRVKKAIT